MATIKDVARIAGVSVSTVSHVVNGTRYVSPEKVRKVEDAIRQLDELPNFIAKRSALKSKLSESCYVLILLSKKRSLFQNQVKEKLEEIVEQKGYIAISLAYDLDEDRLAAIRALAGTLDLAGMVAFPDREGVLSGAFFKGLRFPVVLIGNPVDRFAADTLLPDTFEGSYRAVRHLIKNGHERIAYLCESEVCGTQRFEGYRKALEDSGIASEKVLVRAGLKTEALAAEAMAQIVAAEPAPTAVVIADSLPLIPAIRYGIGHNIAVPGDLSVVSLNDPEWASLTRRSSLAWISNHGSLRFPPRTCCSGGLTAAKLQTSLRPRMRTARKLSHQSSMCATPPAESAGVLRGTGSGCGRPCLIRSGKGKDSAKTVYGGDLIPLYGQGVDAPAGKGHQKSLRRAWDFHYRCHRRSFQRGTAMQTVGKHQISEAGSPNLDPR